MPPGIGILAGAQLQAHRRSLQFESLGEESFQVAAIAVGQLVELVAVDDDGGRIDAALVRVAQLGPEQAGARRRLPRGRLRSSARVSLGVGSLAMAAA